MIFVSNYINLRKNFITNFVNLPLAIFLKNFYFLNNLSCGHSSVVERLVANEKVEGSTPFARSKKKDL